MIIKIIKKIVVDSITYIGYTHNRKEDTMTEAQKNASKKYDKENTRTFTIKLNYNTDADLIAFLEMLSNVQGYIKELISRDLRRKTGGYDDYKN